MKALSLKQPFAERVVSGKKTIELRNWNTKFRGKFMIHASKVPDKTAMERFGFEYLPLGVIVGEAELVDVKIYNSDEEHAKDKTKHLASGSWGKHGFVLGKVKRIEPIPAKGMLGFWEFSEL